MPPVAATRRGLGEDLFHDSVIQFGRVAQLPEPVERGAFNRGLGEAHGCGGLGFLGFGSFFKSFVA